MRYILCWQAYRLRCVIKIDPEFIKFRFYQGESVNILKEVIENIEPVNREIMRIVEKRLDNLTKPAGSLGRLEELARKVAGITGSECPPVKNKVIFTLAADHGVAEEGVSAYPQEVTAQMVYNFLKGGAGINVLARYVGARVIVVDMGVKEKFKVRSPIFIDKKINYGTKNFTRGPAMTRKEAIRAIESGIEVFEEENKKQKIDILGTGDMGIGNTTPSSAIAAVFTGKKVEDLTGMGTGINVYTFRRKVMAIQNGIKKNKPDPEDPVDVLSKVGGFEIGGLAGIILAGAKAKIPVVLDGFISGAAALIAFKLAPGVKDYIIAAHCSAERGHKAILEYLGLKPLLDLGMRLGEGTGAALGIALVEAGIKILTEMATFESAGVSPKIGVQT